ncbi:hypothetical protein [Chitinophaga tropicalis]|uniref:Uncharacterized protein n=1 Tax=Chitinophaga tropicalis TaxID=2683588 RepID=A0A7K1UAF8_9BACT|nr:hypothetical protein [Chitinophaga tropicalis]MVT11361.1 hypothetical protein [Chitinophaga tropicalis]
MPHLTVNLDGSRRHLWNAFNSIVKTFNEGINKDSREIRISIDDLERHVSNLQSHIATLCCSYIEGSEVFTDISENLPDVVEFNPNDL